MTLPPKPTPTLIHPASSWRPGTAPPYDDKSNSARHHVEPPEPAGSFRRYSTLAPSTIQMKRSPIRPVSDKQRARTKVWKKVSAERSRQVNGRCEVRAPGICWGHGTDGHHRRKRSQERLDVIENCVWVCRPCHDFIRDNETWAVANGWIVQRKEAI